MVTSKNRCHPRGDRRSAGVGLYPATFGVVANTMGQVLIMAASVTGGGVDPHSPSLSYEPSPSPSSPSSPSPSSPVQECRQGLLPIPVEGRRRGRSLCLATQLSPSKTQSKLYCQQAHRPLPAGAVSGQILNSDQTACLCHVSHLNQPIRLENSKR